METNIIYNEDCLDGMKRIPEGGVDCIICDLPYGTTACKWDSLIPFEPLWEQYRRVCKKGAPIILFGSEPFSTRIRISNLEWFKYDWIWIKDKPTGFQHAKNMPLKDYEVVSVFSEKGMGHTSQLGQNRMVYNPQGLQKCHKMVKGARSKFGGVVGKRDSHVDTYVAEYENYPTMTLYFPMDTNTFHPTQKPVDLIRYLIRTYSNEGDTILDNCMGSGTTAIACIKEKRNYIGFELDKEYYDKAMERIKNEESQGVLF